MMIISEEALLVRLPFRTTRIRTVISITRSPLLNRLKKKKMSDVQLNPPLRIQPTTAKKIPAKSAQARVSQFLDDYQERHVLARTQGDSTVIAQLQKLSDALAQEQVMRKSK